jgi:hypothetical protein
MRIENWLILKPESGQNGVKNGENGLLRLLLGQWVAFATC